MDSGKPGASSREKSHYKNLMVTVRSPWKNQTSLSEGGGEAAAGGSQDDTEEPSPCAKDVFLNEEKSHHQCFR